MKKPQPKTEVKIVAFRQGTSISFYASKDFSEFGVIEDVSNGIKVLTLDQRYDFNEVLEYIRNYQAVCEILGCDKIAETRYANLRVCNKHAK